MWAGSNADRRGRERRDSRSGDKDKAGKERSRSRRRRRQHNEDKAEFNGKLMTLDLYLMKRRFFFLHLYSGPHDPLGTTLERLAKRCKMKVTVESYDRENGGADLLADQPYAKLLQQAREGKWDGYHAGFPCTLLLEIAVAGERGLSRSMPLQITPLWDTRELSCSSEGM